MSKDEVIQQSWIKDFSNRRYQTRLVGSEFVAHQREFHIVALIQQGELTLKYRERNYTLIIGDAVVIPAGEIHSFSTPKDQPPLVVFHYIDTVDAITASNGLLFPIVDTLTSTKKIAKQLVPPLFLSLDTPIESHFYQQWLSALITALSEHLNQKTKVNGSDINSLIAAKNHIQENLEQPFCLADISSLFNIDKWQLSRKFKPLFGVTLFQHIHASRMVEAKNLLSQQKDICKVALDLGYSDQSHFTRFFKRFVGISPTHWIKLVSSKRQ
jgi:AraC-like DNA-binding protein